MARSKSDRYNGTGEAVLGGLCADAPEERHRRRPDHKEESSSEIAKRARLSVSYAVLRPAIFSCHQADIYPASILGGHQFFLSNSFY